MEVKAGYKNTELGILPEGWNVCKIQNLLDNKLIIGHLDGNHGALYPRSSEFSDFGIPYITANDFDQGYVNFSNVRFLPYERASKFKKGVAVNGDVLFAHNATVGPVALLLTNYKFVVLSTTATFFRTDNDKLNNSFLSYLLQDSSFVRQYSAVMKQSTRNQVPITQQRKLLVKLPPLTEQAAIAEVLSDSDNLIQALEKQIAKKRNIKQGAMQKLLLPKEGWEVKKLGDLNFDISDGNYSSKYPSSSEFKEFGIPFIRANNIKKMTVIDDDMRYISSELHLELAKGHLKACDILITTRGEIGKIAIVPKKFVDANINAQIVRINTNNKINNGSL